MTIAFKGTLLVKKIRHSRNGPFCVADLITPEGEFKVKDQLLDQFEEGEYKGTFYVAELFLAQYIDTFGRAVTELRARLEDLQVDNGRNVPKKREVIEREPDPVDEPPPVRAPKVDHEKTAAGKFKPSAGKADQRGPRAKTSHSDQALFGDELFEAIDAGQSVIKLDPTISDRVRFRSQAARMIELGYEFRSKSQTYHKLS